MAQLILTEQQAEVIRQAMDSSVQVCDPTGKVLAEIMPEMNREFLAELKRQGSSAGPVYTSQQVQARLQALEAEWHRTGGFDEAHLREFLAKQDETDPPHWQTSRAPA